MKIIRKFRVTKQRVRGVIKEQAQPNGSIGRIHNYQLKFGHPDTIYITSAFVEVD